MKKYFYIQPTFTESTWALLAFSRFILALIVMVSSGHLNNFTVLSVPLEYISMLGGKTNVVVFLLISGISVGCSFAKNKKGFLMRRFLRIYPLYFIAIMGTVLLQYFLGSPYLVKDTLFVTAGNLTSVANLMLLQGIASYSIMYNSPVWSISVEVFLYIMLPFFFNLRLRYIYMIAIISVLLYTFINLFPFSIHLKGVQHAMNTWPFILGFLVATKRQFWFLIPIILFGAFGIYYNNLMGLGFEKYVFIWFLIAVFIVFIILYFKIELSKKVIFLFNFLGTISFPMYLFHIPLYFILYHLGIRESIAFVGLVIVLCIPINYIFDVWLKKIFWIPFLGKAEIIGGVLMNKLNPFKFNKI